MTDLDDVTALEAADPDQMLRAVASSAAQLREALELCAEAGVASLADEGRPRAVVVCGMGGSGIAGDVLSAIAGLGSPVPVVSHRGFGLPAWVGAADLVVAVSCSGTTEETLSALEEAVRRGCRLLVVGASGSPVAELGARGRGLHVPVPQGRQPRASLWALSTPLLVAGDALGLLSAPASDLEAAAVLLEELARRCAPTVDAAANPGKSLATELDEHLPVVWGTSGVSGTAAYRFASQLAENAAAPAAWGVLPEAGHNAVVTLDGPWGAGTRISDDDFFRDRTGDEPHRVPMRLVLLREEGEHPRVAERARVVADLAEERGVPVTQLQAEGGSAVERLASLIAIGDYASTYLALLQGTDPTPVVAIDDLKARTRRS